MVTRSDVCDGGRSEVCFIPANSRPCVLPVEDCTTPERDTKTLIEDLELCCLCWRMDLQRYDITHPSISGTGGVPENRCEGTGSFLLHGCTPSRDSYNRSPISQVLVLFGGYVSHYVPITFYPLFSLIEEGSLVPSPTRANLLLEDHATNLDKVHVLSA
jgi:hypothetical protein